MIVSLLISPAVSPAVSPAMAPAVVPAVAPTVAPAVAPAVADNVVRRWLVDRLLTYIPGGQIEAPGIEIYVLPDFRQLPKLTRATFNRSKIWQISRYGEMRHHLISR